MQRQASYTPEQLKSALSLAVTQMTGDTGRDAMPSKILVSKNLTPGQADSEPVILSNCADIHNAIATQTAVFTNRQRRADQTITDINTSDATIDGVPLSRLSAFDQVSVILGQLESIPADRRSGSQKKLIEGLNMLQRMGPAVVSAALQENNNKAAMQGLRDDISLGSGLEFIGKLVAKLAQLMLALFMGFQQGFYSALVPVMMNMAMAMVVAIAPVLFVMGLLVPQWSIGIMATPVLVVAYIKVVEIMFVLVYSLFGLFDKFMFPERSLLERCAESFVASSMAGGAGGLWTFGKMGGAVGAAGGVTASCVLGGEHETTRNIFFIAMGTAYTSCFLLAGYFMAKMGNASEVVTKIAEMDAKGKLDFKEAMGQVVAPLATAGAVAGGAFMAKGAAVAGWKAAAKDGKNKFLGALGGLGEVAKANVTRFTGGKSFEESAEEGENIVIKDRADRKRPKPSVEQRLTSIDSAAYGERVKLASSVATDLADDIADKILAKKEAFEILDLKAPGVDSTLIAQGVFGATTQGQADEKASLAKTAQRLGARDLVRDDIFSLTLENGEKLNADNPFVTIIHNTANQMLREDLAKAEQQLSGEELATYRSQQGIREMALRKALARRMTQTLMDARGENIDITAEVKVGEIDYNSDIYQASLSENFAERLRSNGFVLSEERDKKGREKGVWVEEDGNRVFKFQNNIDRPQNVQIKGTSALSSPVEIGPTAAGPMLAGSRYCSRWGDG